jgi:hypothetical protein
MPSAVPKYSLAKAMSPPSAGTQSSPPSAFAIKPSSEVNM